MGFLTSSSLTGTAKFHPVAVLPITLPNALAILEVEVDMKFCVGTFQNFALCACSQALERAGTSRLLKIAYTSLSSNQRTFVPWLGSVLL